MKVKSSWPNFEDSELKAAVNVLTSGKINYWTGEEGKLFEEDFAQWCGTKRAIALANGTMALLAAYNAIKFDADYEIITTPRSFIATASSALLAGANTIFADVDTDSGAITAKTIEPLITSKTKAISVVHLGGWPADMPAILDLAKSYGLKVVEDCSQAHGATINEKSVGSFGDIGTWSFCQDKIISTAGEGGMITTNDEHLWEEVRAFKDHGKNINLITQNDQVQSGFKYVHESIGANLRLTEIQSAIGRLQLRKLHMWNSIRNRNALLLASILTKSNAVRIPLPPEGIKHAWYKFYAYINPEALLGDWTRDRIIQEIVSSGAPAFSGSCSEIYLEKCFLDKSQKLPVSLPKAKLLGETSLMFQIDQTMEVSTIEKYGQIILSVLQRASR